MRPLPRNDACVNTWGREWGNEQAESLAALRWLWAWRIPVWREGRRLLHGSSDCGTCRQALHRDDAIEGVDSAYAYDWRG
jgi:hypothetical protein